MTTYHMILPKTVQVPAKRCTDVIMAFDPGPGFGWASYVPYPAVPGMHFDAGVTEISDDGHAAVAYLINDFRDIRNVHQGAFQVPDDVVVDGWIVAEKFEYRKDDAEQRDRIDFTAAEYVGVIKLIGNQLFPDRVHMQGSSEAKGFWDNDKLREVGLYVPNRHARDALRHLLHFMTFTLHQKWLLQALKEK